MRPGPAAIPSGEAPAGVVVHVYDVAGHLVAESHLTPGDDVEAKAERAYAQTAATLPDGEAVVIVAYDGDTGARLTRAEWLEWLLT